MNAIVSRVRPQMTDGEVETRDSRVKQPRCTAEEHAARLRAQGLNARVIDGDELVRELELLSMVD